ncbi:MAG: hypothetical protein LQ347_002863 [Umbilicaria vellea]|nr:MAG: hypothetical protein LQ347_002863 [Umbilicaria vellea]
MTLDEALDQHIKPGVILLRKREWVKGEALRSPEQYVLANLKTTDVPPNFSKRHSGQSRARGAKQIFLHTWADIGYCKHKLETAYFMLKSNFRVEFHVGEKKGGDRDFRSSVRLSHDLVHLRPEVIQKAMPENSGIIISPQTDFREYCWVVAGPRNKDGRITKPPMITQKFYKSQKLQVELQKKRELIDQRKAETTKPPMITQKLQAKLRKQERLIPDQRKAGTTKLLTIIRKLNSSPKLQVELQKKKELIPDQRKAETKKLIGEQRKKSTEFPRNFSVKLGRWLRPPYSD